MAKRNPKPDLEETVMQAAKINVQRQREQVMAAMKQKEINGIRDRKTS